MIKVVNLTKHYGDRKVFQNSNFEISPGEFVILRGASGCGKSTLLRIIAGLEGQNGGSVYLKGEPADGLAPNQRGISLVFQEAAIFSHLSVKANIAFSLNRNDQAARGRMESLLDALELRKIQNSRPSQISGGEAKRVAVARALAIDCPIYLFDEALTNLDPALKRNVFNTIREHTKDKTVLYVTHEKDVEEYGQFPAYSLVNGVFLSA